MKKINILLLLVLLTTGCQNSKKEVTPVATEKINIENKTKMEKNINSSKKIKLYNNINDLIQKLSENGIGNLRKWKGDELGWYSFTDYFSFGSKSDINGMQNNIAYYINSDNKNYAKEVKITVNINNNKETQKALKLLNTVSKKTIESLNLKMPLGLSQSILKQKPKKFTNDTYSISLELDKSKIDTWNLIIYTK